MARTCPIGFNADQLRREVLATYERVAAAPGGEFHFHRGAKYAVERLGYDALELASLPAWATKRFAGVGNPLSLGPVYPGETVLDHACGSGTDLLLAAQRVGRSGRAIGVDMTPGMRRSALLAAEEAGLSSIVEVRAGVFEHLPVDDGSVDVVISNGVLNLAPDKEQVMAEIVRVLRPGGRLYLADVVLQRELSLATRSNADLWAACVAGALPEEDLPLLAEDAGLTSARLVACFDPFADTVVPNRLARDVRAHAVTLYAEKPSQ